MHAFILVQVFAATIVGEVLGSKYNGPTALPVVLHNGYLADTHEVAAAKSAHLNTLSQQSHGRSYGLQGDSDYSHGDSRYHGYATLPQIQREGHIADTHEVAAAKAEHFAAVAKARSLAGYSHGGVYSGQYDHGYTTLPQVQHDRHIADTREVAAAKAEHFAAVAKARSQPGYSHGGDYSGQYSGAYGYGTHASGYFAHGGTHAAYQGPLAKPVVLPSGYLADTVEVANAKQQHYHLVHSSQSKHLY